MILDEGDRAKFCAYARVQIESADRVIRQLAAINAPELVIQRERLRMLGYKVVLDDLKAMEPGDKQ